MNQAVPTAASSPARYDIYAYIHKALRAWLGDTLQLVGCTDGGDPQQVQEALAQARALFGFCHRHLKHENEFVHTAMEARSPGSAHSASGDHVHHEWELEQLESLADTVEQAQGGARMQALCRLYRYLALFVAENLTHMHAEEVEHNAVLWKAYSDDELRAIERSIVASIPPAETMLTMRWMLPALTHEERVEFLRGMQLQAPPPVFAAVCDIARAHMPPRDWEKLSQALGAAEKIAA